MLLGVQDEKGQYVVKGVVPEMGNAIAMMIKNPPASGELWLADLLQHSPLVSQAYAQGIGFKSLNPILPVWKAFRDLSYVVFVLVFIAIGFMIMFRKNLHGQTVITISNALPNLVITLLLITFSYAIAGFMIDIMYLVIYFITGVFANLIDTSKFGDNLTLIDIALSRDIVTNGLGLIFGIGDSGVKGSVVGGAAKAIGDIAENLFANTGDFASNIVGKSVGVVGYVIIAVAMFFAVIKTFFELLKSYVTFIISVIFAPFQLLLGALKDGGDFVQWIKNLAATLLPFPVVIVMIFLALALGGSGKGSIGYRAGDTGGFQAPQITVGDGFSGAASGLIALGILMLIPEAVEMSKKWLGAKGLMDEWLPKIGENLGKGWKGGQLVPGIGPTLPGMGKILPEALSLGATSSLGAIGGAAVGAYSQRGQGVGKMLAGGLIGTGVGAVAPATIKYVAPQVDKVAKFANQQITNIKIAEQIGQVLTPEKVPETPETKKRKETISNLQPSRNESVKGDEGFPV